MYERIQKTFSRLGILSRRAAEKAILDGRVTIDGRPAVLGDKVDAQINQIALDGRLIEGEREVRPLYLMLNKPRGYITSLSDERGRKTAAELVKDCGERVYPVGRLDMDSEGLLLFTNDGDFANLVMHPRNRVGKSYELTVEGSVSKEQLEILGSPLIIDAYKITPARVFLTRAGEGSSKLLVTIFEGRNRQIRKMCVQAGLKLKRLKRVKLGPLTLGDLKIGCWRHLQEEELKKFREILQGKQRYPAKHP